MINNFKIFESQEQYITTITKDESEKILSKIDVSKYTIYRKVKNDVEQLYGDFTSYNEYEDYNIVNPKLITRVSPYAEYNIYNLLLSNLPSWKEYPKREKSLICGSYERVDCQAGDMICTVTPIEKNVKIAICPTRDIWESFKTIVEEENLNDFQRKLVEKFDAKLIDEPSLIKNKEDFCSYLNYSIKEVHDAADKWLSNSITTIELLDIILDPKLNGFELVEYNKNFTYDDNGEVELWTDATSLLINEDVIRD